MYERKNPCEKKKKININMKFKDYYQEQEEELKPGDRCKNINPDCEHFGSEGIVVKVFDINQNDGENRIGKAVEYKVSNNGSSFKQGETLTKTLDQLKKT